MSVECPVCKEMVEDLHYHFYNYYACMEVGSTTVDSHISFIDKAISKLLYDMANLHNFEIIDNCASDHKALFTDLFLSNVLKALGFNIRKRVGTSRKLKFIRNLKYTDLKEVLRASVPYEFAHRLNDQAVLLNSFYNTSNDICASCSIDESDDNEMTTRFISGRTRLLSNFEMLCPRCIEDREGSQSVAITKTFYFAAAHHLPGHPGLCFFTHGHEWKLEVTVKNNISKTSTMTMDFSDLKNAVEECIIAKLDHNYINDFLYNPTAENMCLWIWKQLMIEGNLKGIENIKLWEAPNSYADFSRADMVNYLC